MESHVLVVFPHPDDESFGTAGTIIQSRQQDIPVTYACGTLGEMGRNMGKPLFANRETLPEIRKKELLDACDIMGVEDLRMLGMRDKTIEFENTETLVNRMKNLIEETQASLVITHYPGYAVHPDHNALGAAVVKAVSLMPADKRPVLRCHAFAENTKEDLGEPDTVIDVRDVLDEKIDALKAHGSQTQQLVKGLSQADPKEDSQLVNWLGWERFWTYRL